MALRPFCEGVAPRAPLSLPNAHLARRTEMLQDDPQDARALRTRRRDVQQELARLDNHQTPYGKLIENLDLELSDGERFRLPYINPFALLHTLSFICNACGDMLRETVQGEWGGFAFTSTK